MKFPWKILIPVNFAGEPRYIGHCMFFIAINSGCPMFSRFFFLLITGLFFVASPAWAEAQHNTQARLISAVKGTDHLQTIQVGVEVKLNDGWKTYWRTPGEAGLAPVFNWAGSENLDSAKVSWPAPRRFSAFDIDNFDYENKVVFPVQITPKVEGKAITLNLKLDLLVCKDLCVPESHTISLTIPAGDAEVSADQAELAEAVLKIPAAGDNNGFSIEKAWLEQGNDKGNDKGNEQGKDKTVYLHAFGHVTRAPGANADMFVESQNSIPVGKPSFIYNAPTHELQVQAPVRSGDTLEKLEKNLGSNPLTLTFVDGARAFERQVTLRSSSPESASMGNILRATQEHIDPAILLLAFLGGLILNLMPCVLPVLGIKVLGVLSHGGKDHRIHRWAIFRTFMASAAGIVFSFWLMAIALIGLKNAGETIGWGIQFQHPGFLILMIVILSAFAANMWGLFEIPLPRFIAKNLPILHEHEPTLLGHFLTGVFATLLATPCTAPFLGTAVGFALSREALDIMIVFTFMGLGLAAPYLLLAVTPRIFKYMPKPGAWMVVLRKVLSVALALTAAWLISVLVTVMTQPTLDDGWTKFSEALIKPAVTDGKTVVVDVTADWCLTCKANKRRVFDEIEDAMFVPNVLLLQADWTHADPAISAYLKEYGRAGVPFNIVYGPGAPQGIILSEWLTKEDVMRALSQAAGE